MLKIKLVSLAVLTTLSSAFTYADDFKILKQISEKPTLLKEGAYKGNYYVPSTLNTITWGYLPNRDAKTCFNCKFW